MSIRRSAFLALCLGFGLVACGSPPASGTGSDDASQDAADVAMAGDATPDSDKYVGKCAKGPSICDDGNPCTIDDCDPAKGCITTIKPCADSDPCTLDSCDVTTGDCQHVPDPCDDGNACTTGSCTPGSGCLFAAVDCSDSDACTSDGCTPSSGCLHASLNCDDGLTCTVDSCNSASGCVHKQQGAGKCCESDPDCDDNNVCTAEHCVGGFCNSQGIFGCCKTDADCDDANACTADSCDVGNGACSNTAQSGGNCCQSDADCNDQKPCTLDRCVQNACAHEVTCCKAASDCQLSAMAIDSCGDPTCTSAGCGLVNAGGSCCTPSVKATGFETSDAWTVKTSPAGAGSWSIESGKTPVQGGSGALVYRSATQKILGGGSAAIARLASVSLPAGTAVALKFQYASQVTAAEVVRLRAFTSLGVWLIWQGPNTGGAWQAQSVNLSGFAARTGAQVISLQWEVTPQAGVTGASSVIAVDTVQITSTCGATACKIAADCNDGLAATADSCGNGQCIYVTASDYCETSASCDDANVCTSDSCLPNQFKCNHGKVFNCCLDTTACDDGNVCTLDACNFSNQCSHQTLPASQCCNTLGDCDDANVCTQDSCPAVGMPCAHTQADANCCMSAKNCDDGQKCTVDACVQNQCSHSYVCCTTAKDCDDGDDLCTNDSCVNLFCEHTPTGAAGCCTPIIWQQDMEDGVIPTLWTASASSSAVMWQWSNKLAHGGTGALWYGNLATGDYSDGSNQNTGSLQSAPIDLPTGDTAEFSMWVWLDTELGPPYDELTLSVTVDGKTLTLWTKHQDKDANGADLWQLQTWYQIHANLSAFAGKAIVLTLAFDTVDGVGNSGKGVFVDDIALTRACAPLTCTTPADCDDKLTGTQDGCAAGHCTYAY